MSNPFLIYASGLAASAARFSNAAGKVVSGLTGGPAPKVPQAQPASASPPGAAPAASPPGTPVAGGTTVNAQQQAEPASWMVEILRARAAYSANAAGLKTAEKMADETIDLIG